MNELRILSEEANDILIAGHIRPDGDCVGACIAAYHYLHNIYPEKNIEVYLENTPETFAFMDKDNAIISHTITDKQYDLFSGIGYKFAGSFRRKHKRISFVRK